MRLDRARPVQREDWRLREEPHQLFRRLRFDAVPVSLLRHECEVVQGAKQAAIPGPTERDLRHPRAFFADVRGSDADSGQSVAHSVMKHRG
jgi:hypothetical protein